MALDHENRMASEIFMSSDICVFYRPDLHLVCKLHKMSRDIYNFGINWFISLLSIITQSLNLIDSVLRKIMGFQYFTDQVCKMTSSEIFYHFEFYFWIKLFLFIIISNCAQFHCYWICSLGDIVYYIVYGCERKKKKAQ